MHRQPHHQEVAGRFKADLHAHTAASHDSKTTVRQLLAAAKAAGLDAVAVTDHDSVASHEEALRLAPSYGIQVIPGVEITAEGGTHVVAYYLRELPKSRKIQDVLRFIREQGGVSCLAHLYRSDTGLLYNHAEKGQFTKKEVADILANVDLVETVNFKSAFRGEPDGEKIAKAAGKPALASTDAHYPVEVGKAFTVFDLPSNLPLTPASLRHANRELWIHPVAATPQKKAALPLTNYEPSESKVRSLKKVFGPLIPLAGKALYAWQELGRQRAKKRQIMTFLETSPTPELYRPR